MTISEYNTSDHSAAVPGGGDIEVRQNAGILIDAYFDTLKLAYSQIKGLDDTWNIYTKFTLGPDPTKGSQDEIPVGSTIISAKLVVRPTTTEVAAMGFRIGVLKREARDLNGYSAINATWFVDESTYAEFDQIWFRCSILNNGGRVDDATAIRVLAPGFNQAGINLRRSGSADDEAIYTVAQENKIIGSPNALFDEIQMGLGHGDDTLDDDVWVEVWDSPPTAKLVNPGMLLATSDKVATSTLVGPNTGPVQFFFTSDPGGPEIDLGAGDKTVWVVVRSDAPDFQVKCQYTEHDGATIGYKGRTVGRGSGFQELLYPSSFSIPNISGVNDDILNSNVHGDTVPFTLDFWLGGVDFDLVGLEGIVQAWIDDPLYVPGEPIGLVLDKLEGESFTRLIYSSDHPTEPGPRLVIEHAIVVDDSCLEIAALSAVGAVASKLTTLGAVQSEIESVGAVSARIENKKAVSASLAAAGAVKARLEICQK